MDILKNKAVKIPVNITVNLTKTEIKTIRDAIGLKGSNTNEVILKALISTAKSKRLKLWN